MLHIILWKDPREFLEKGNIIDNLFLQITLNQINNKCFMQFLKVELVQCFHEPMIKPFDPHHLASSEF